MRREADRNTLTGAINGRYTTRHAAKSTARGVLASRSQRRATPIQRRRAMRRGNHLGTAKPVREPVCPRPLVLFTERWYTCTGTNNAAASLLASVDRPLRVESDILGLNLRTGIFISRRDLNPTRLHSLSASRIEGLGRPSSGTEAFARSRVRKKRPEVD